MYRYTIFLILFPPCDIFLKCIHSSIILFFSRLKVYRSSSTKSWRWRKGTLQKATPPRTQRALAMLLLFVEAGVAEAVVAVASGVASVAVASAVVASVVPSATGAVVAASVMWATWARRSGTLWRGPPHQRRRRPRSTSCPICTPPLLIARARRRGWWGKNLSPRCEALLRGTDHERPSFVLMTMTYVTIRERQSNI